MLTFTPQDRATHLALYNDLARPNERNQITLPLGQAPVVPSRLIERSTEMVLTYFCAREVQDRPLSTGEADMLKRANEAVSEVRDLFFHGRADVKADRRPPRFPSPAVLYEAVCRATTGLSAFEHAGVCAHMGCGTEEEFAHATAAVLVSKLGTSESVEIRQFEAAGGLSTTSVAFLVGPDGEVLCDSWGEGPAVQWQDSARSGCIVRSRENVDQLELSQFSKGFKTTAPANATAIAGQMDAGHRARHRSLDKPGATVSKAFDAQTHSAMGSYVNSRGVTRYTSGFGGVGTKIRHAFVGKSDERTQYQKNHSDHLRLEKARTQARLLNVDPAKVDTVATFVLQGADRLSKMVTSASWRHEHETQGTVVQR